MDEIKAAMRHTRGWQGDITDAEVKAWGLGHFQQLVETYRQSLINESNPVPTTPIAT